MRAALRWLFAVIVILHGLIHLLGAAKGFGWAEVHELTATPSVAAAVGWLAASVLLITTGITLLLRNRYWWVLGAAALVLSQVLVFSSWTDARAGAAANVLLLIGVGYGYASEGPTGYRARYRRLRADALAAPVVDPAAPVVDGVLNDADLADLPRPVAGYLRYCGAVGQPRVGNFRALIHGRIRSGPAKPWMAFTGEQVNTYGAVPSRVLLMDATMFGLPVDVLHACTNGHATMQVQFCSLLRMVDAAGPDMDRAETVTMFNDLCVLSPAALVDADVRWQSIDDSRVRGEFTNGAHTVAAELIFGADGSLVDFVSDDRLRSAPHGDFVRQRWSTPIGGYRTVGSRRVSTCGEARWHAPEPEGEFAYLEFRVDAIDYNVASDGVLGHPAAVPQPVAPAA